MTRIGIRELRQHASQYIERVKTGETIEVTDRGELVALLISPSLSNSRRDRLIQQGVVIPSRSPFRIPSTRRNLAAGETTASLLEDLREDKI